MGTILPNLGTPKCAATFAAHADESSIAHYLPQQHRHGDAADRGGGHGGVTAALRVVGVLPVRGPGFLGDVVVAAAAEEIGDHALDHVDAVGEDERHPVPVRAFAELIRVLAEQSAQTFW